MDMRVFVPTPENKVADRIYQMPLGGLFFVEAPKHEDFRGFYAEISILPDLQTVLPQEFVVKQANLSRSVTNVARGFHAEQWNKLITIVRGTAFCAWVDVRPHSPTFGQTVTLIMGDEAPMFGSVFISTGIANGYVVTSGPVDYCYATDGLYRDRDPKFDVSLSLFDNDLAVPWPVPRMEMLLSQRDKQAVSLKELQMIHT